MNKTVIDKSFISDYDKFLREFDASHDKSPAQLKEIEKHQRIANMRDNAEKSDEKGEIWQDF